MPSPHFARAQLLLVHVIAGSLHLHFSHFIEPRISTKRPKYAYIIYESCLI